MWKVLNTWFCWRQQLLEVLVKILEETGNEQAIQLSLSHLIHLMSSNTLTHVHSLSTYEAVTAEGKVCGLAMRCWWLTVVCCILLFFCQGPVLAALENHGSVCLYKMQFRPNTLKIILCFCLWRNSL